MRKKLFTILLAIVAGIGTLFAESGTCGDNLTWDLTDGVLTISGTGAMTDWSNSGLVPWDSLRDSITSVTIGDSVTSIGSLAFYNVSGLTNIMIPSSVTRIGVMAFENCDHLETVEIEGYSECEKCTVYGNLLYIRAGAFRDCSKLSHITLREGLSTIEEFAFYRCYSIISLYVPSSVQTIRSNAFEGILNIEYSGNLGIYSSVVVSNFGAKCRNGIIDGALVYEDEAKTILIGCSTGALSQVVIPQSVKTVKAYTFGDCKIDTLTFAHSISPEDENQEQFNEEAILTIEEKAFTNRDNRYCNIYNVNILDLYTWCNIVWSYGNGSFLHDYSLLINGKRETDLAIPSTVTSIKDYAFQNCISIKTVTIPNSVTTIGRHAFYHCSSLTVSIPNSVTTIGEYAFENVFNIQYTGRATGSPWGARSINGFVEGYLAYSDAYKTNVLTCSLKADTIIIPASVTQITKDAFKGVQPVTHITDLAAWCSVNVNNKESSSHPTRLYVNGERIDDLVIPSGVTRINPYVFSQCNVDSVTFPPSLYSIGSNAFYETTT
ncbi:MAG: leucine-rich repeat domain-containing protein [Paludibacteraceae bacterium]|nr:leucine-rich repeat domain-containing protein [Paludibacteraceae bacterium]